MNITSILRYPPSDRFVRIHESLVRVCENVCAAALITFFEGWHNYRLEQAEYTKLYNQMLQDNQQPPIIDTSGWQYHTNLQLERGVLIYKIDTINEALQLLEERHFISTEVPDRLRMLYKTGRTRWFLLMTSNVQQCLDEVANSGKVFNFPLRQKRRPKPAAPAVASDEAFEVFDYWKVVTQHQKAVADPKRLQLIRERLKEGFTPNQLKQAVDGNMVSPYHRGENDRNQVYDRVELIFGSASDVERFIGYLKKHVPAKPKVSSDIPALARLLMPLVFNPQPEALKRLSAQYKGVVYKDLYLEVRKQIEGKIGMFTAPHGANLKQVISQIKELNNE